MVSSIDMFSQISIMNLNFTTGLRNLWVLSLLFASVVGCTQEQSLTVSSDVRSSSLQSISTSEGISFFHEVPIKQNLVDLFILSERLEIPSLINFSSESQADICLSGWHTSKQGEVGIAPAGSHERAAHLTSPTADQPSPPHPGPKTKAWQVRGW